MLKIKLLAKIMNRLGLKNKIADFDISKRISICTTTTPHGIVNMEEETDQSNDNRPNRLGDCEVCGSKDGRYTCPRCEVKTCSAACVKIHKKELDCNGERDKTGFVPLSKFSNLNLLGDYRFLEDASRTIDNCRRNPLKKYTRYKTSLPPHLHKLRREALRRKTALQYLPQHFTRHKDNTTFLRFDTKIIYWRLELIFPQADNIKIVIEKCNENERLSAVLSQYVDCDKCPELYKKRLQFYHSVGIPGLEVLLKAENIKIQPSFFILDMSSTLKENFEDRIIIEYPILYVIHKSHKDEYTILDPDMEVDTNVVSNKFNEFIPFSFFNNVTYTQKSAREKAAESIHASVAQLRTYFGGVSDDEINDYDVKSDTPKTLNILPYDNLIKEST